MRLSLRWKLVGGFGLLLALIVLLGWVTLSLFGSLRSVQRRVFNEAVPGLVAVDEIVRSYTAQSAAVRGSLITASQQTLLDRYQFEVITAEFWEERALELFTAGDERERLDRLIEAGDEFHQLVDEEIVPLATAGNRTRAGLILDQQGSRLISEIEIQGELLREQQQNRVNEADLELATRSRQALVIFVVVLVGVFLAGIMLAYLLPRRLSRNLDRLVAATRAIGRGDLDQEVVIDSGDEVEELAHRFRDMQSGLKRLQQLALQDRELEIAASIQRNLLRREIPRTPGLRVVPLQHQANLVGGDWYDVEVVARRVNLVVGDASGKGIAAALMATVALSFLRAERALGSSPKKAVERTNDALLDATDPDSFTTMIYATLDSGSGEVRWLNMGHPAPFLLQTPTGDGGRPHGYYVEGPRNRALGWFENPGLTETMLRLDPGDCLVFFTDGFLEAKSPEGEVFGENRFADALTRLAPVGADAIGERLIREVEQFAAGKLDDDLTMLIVEFEGAELSTEEPRAVPAEPEEKFTSSSQARTQRRTGEETWHSRR